MRILKRGLTALFVLLVVALTIDYWMVRNRDARVWGIVARIGGKGGSIPYWPIGTEYIIKFSQALTTDQLDELAEMNLLRGSVTVVFDCGLSDEQTAATLTKLYNCRLFRIVAGERKPLGIRRDGTGPSP